MGVPPFATFLIAGGFKFNQFAIDCQAGFKGWPDGQLLGHRQQKARVPSRFLSLARVARLTPSRLQKPSPASRNSIGFGCSGRIDHMGVPRQDRPLGSRRSKGNAKGPAAKALAVPRGMIPRGIPVPIHRARQPQTRCHLHPKAYDHRAARIHSRVGLRFSWRRWRWPGRVGSTSILVNHHIQQNLRLQEDSGSGRVLVLGDLPARPRGL